MTIQKTLEKITFNCLLCNSDRLIRIFSRPSFPIFLGVHPEKNITLHWLPIELWQCGFCGFVQQRITKKLKLFFQSVYSKDTFLSPPPGMSSLGTIRGIIMLDYLAAFVHKPKSILEIGCRNGFLLSELQKRYSCRAVGIEPGAVGPFPGNITVINDFFPSKKLGRSKFDLILCQFVLEHVFQPAEFLQAIRKHLNPGGFALIQVPDCTNNFSEGDIGLFSHEHISYFTKNTLEYLIRKSQLSLVDITNEIPGGHLLAIMEAGIKDTSFPNADNTPLIYNQQFESNLSRIAGYFRNKNQIGLYGACAGTFNFVHETTHGWSSALYDSDEYKHGKYLSGVHQPIRNYKELVDDPVDLILIMPYTAQNEIHLFLTSLEFKNKKVVKVYET